MEKHYGIKRLKKCCIDRLNRHDLPGVGRNCAIKICGARNSASDYSMDAQELKPGYELVFTVTDYLDGPRKGIANYQDKPHLYECIFDETADDYSESFLLTPLDLETFQQAIEDWKIWRRWEDAFHSGKADKSTHPALPHEAGRHAELKQILDKSLVTDPQKAVTRIGQFDVLGKSDLPRGIIRPLQVKWTELSPHHDVRERRPDLRGYQS